MAGVRPDDTIAHRLNYALYAGGIADRMALEASGATVVPVGVGQSARLLGPIGRLGITALFGTLSYPAHLAARAREATIDPRTGAPAADAAGELVWTHLRREASPLLRYRSADVGRVWTARCPCGRATPPIRVDGRRDDMLRVQAVNVYPPADRSVPRHARRIAG